MRTWLLPTALALALALAAAGCGSTKSPAVADVATGSNSTTTTTAATGGLGTSSSAGGGQATLTMKMADGAKFASCMRSHGVPSFPDPSRNGSLTIGSSSGVNPDSPKFRAAQKACEKLLPHGPPPSPAQQAKMQQAALAFSRCMRAHGLASFPDPQFSAGRISIQVKGRPGGLDPNSPTFRRAQQACQGQLPKIGRATTGSAGAK